MGKAHVQIFNWGPPGSLQMYFQMVGRAGRDSYPARCMLFWSKTGCATRRFMQRQSAATCACCLAPACFALLVSHIV